MKKACWLIVAGLVLTVLVPPAFAESLRVAVAANMQFAFAELAGDFTQQTGIAVETSLGSSGKLTAQIEAGAPFDVFLSADTDYPAYIYKRGLATTSPVIYAYGTLVLWTLTDMDLSPGLNVLTDPRIQHIALPNPKLAPYGREAMHALAYFHLDTAVTAKLITGESIAQVNQYIRSGNTDIGFTAKSVVLSPQLRNQGKWIDVPSQAYTPIAQAAVRLKNRDPIQAQQAQRFMQFLVSAPAHTILQHYGYGVP